MVKAVPKQNDEIASTAAQLWSADRARAARVEKPGNAYRENIGCALALQTPERKKVIHLLDQDFPDLAIVIQSDCRRLNAVRTWRHNESAPTAHG